MAQDAGGTGHGAAGLQWGLPGLLATGTSLSGSSAIGLLTLVGLVVVNAMVLVDGADAAMRAGSGSVEALITTAQRRMRPMLATLLTTLLALLPILMIDGVGIEIQRPLAIVVVCGLTTAAFANLILLPAVLLRRERVR